MRSTLRNLYQTPPRSTVTDRSHYSSTESFIVSNHTSSRIAQRPTNQLKRSLKVYSDLVEDPLCRLKLQPSQVKDVMLLHTGLSVIERYYTNYRKRWMPLIQRQAFNCIKQIAASERYSFHRRSLTPPSVRQRPIRDSHSQEISYHTQNEDSLSREAIKPRSSSNRTIRKAPKKQITTLRFDVLSLAREWSTGSQGTNRQKRLNIHSPYGFEIVSLNLLKAIQLQNILKRVFHALEKNILKGGIQRLREEDQTPLKKSFHKRGQTQPLVETVLLHQHSPKSQPKGKSYRLNNPTMKKKRRRRDSSPSLQLSLEKLKSAFRTPQVYPSGMVEMRDNGSQTSKDQEKKSFISHTLVVESPDRTLSIKRRNQSHMLLLLSRRIGQNMLKGLLMEAFDVICQYKTVAVSKFSVQKSHLPYALNQLARKRRLQYMQRFFHILSLPIFESEDVSHIDRQLNVSLLDSIQIQESELRRTLIAKDLKQIGLAFRRAQMRLTELAFESISQHYRSQKYAHLHRPMKQLTFAIGHVYRYKLIFGFSSIKNASQMQRQTDSTINLSELKDFTKLYKLQIFETIQNRFILSAFTAMKSLKCQRNTPYLTEENMESDSTPRVKPDSEKRKSSFVFPNILQPEEAPKPPESPGDIKPGPKTFGLAQRLAEIKIIDSQQPDQEKTRIPTLKQFLSALKPTQQSSLPAKPYQIKIITPRQSIVKCDNEGQSKTNQFIIVNGGLRLTFILLRFAMVKLKSNYQRQKLVKDGCIHLKALFMDPARGFFMAIRDMNRQRKISEKPRQKQELVKIKQHLLQLNLPQIHEGDKESNYMQIRIHISSKSDKSGSRRSKSAQQFDQVPGFLAGIQICNGEEVTIERDIQLNFYRKMVFASKSQHSLVKPRSNSIQDSPSGTPKQSSIKTFLASEQNQNLIVQASHALEGKPKPMLKKSEKSSSDRNLLTKSLKSNNLLNKKSTVRKVATSPKVILVLKEESNQGKPRKIGQLIELVRQPQNNEATDESSQESDTDSDARPLTQTMMATRKIAAHIAYQNKRTSIVELPRKVRRRGASIQLQNRFHYLRSKEISRIQQRFRIGTKCLVFFLMIALTILAVYNFPHLHQHFDL